MSRAPTWTLAVGDCREAMAAMEADSVQTCVTSPPYWRLRSYLPDEHPHKPAELGQEPSPSAFAANLVDVFRIMRRVLRPDGVLWLNLGDTYARSGKGGGGNRGNRAGWRKIAGRTGMHYPPDGYKPKDLTLVPFAVADALRADGWYLRSVIVWSRPSAVEPLRIDRPSVSHEYLFLLSASEYYACRDPGEPWWGHSVWRIPPDLNDRHEATMPSEMVRRCVVASTRPGDVVLDPFAGSGTVGMVATGHGRSAVLCELNAAYADLIRERCGPMLEAA